MDMRRPFYVSLAVHFLAILLLVIGLPHMQPKKLGDFQSVPIEIVDISKVTQTNREPKTQIKPLNQPTLEPKTVQKTQKEEVKVEQKVEKIQPPKQKPAIAEKPDKAEDVIKKLVEQDKKPTPEEKPKIEPKAPVKKPEEVKKEVKEEVKPDPLASVLKNVAALKDVKKPSPAETEAKEVSDEMSEEAVLPVSEQLSISEEDALRRQIEACWNIPAGARDAENLVVTIKVEMNPDKTVKNVEIVDAKRMMNDNFYRAAAESARRAVLNPKCSPLLLPENKYTLWRNFTISFNPKEMLTQ